MAQSFEAKKEAVIRLLTSIGSLDMDAAGEVLHEDALMCFPYMELVADVRGRAAIVEQIKATVPVVLEGMSFTYDAWYETTDPDVIITEYRSKCQRRGRSDFYENAYIGIYRFSGDKIILYKEYMNPSKLAIFNDQLGPAGT